VTYSVVVHPQVRRNARSYELTFAKPYRKGDRIKFSFVADYYCEAANPIENLWQWESGYRVDQLTLSVSFPDTAPAVRFEIQDTTPAVLHSEAIQTPNGDRHVDKTIVKPVPNLTYVLTW
jgi:hypothetical protein